jgi:hypothetical protein
MDKTQPPQEAETQIPKIILWSGFASFPLAIIWAAYLTVRLGQGQAHDSMTGFLQVIAFVFSFVGCYIVVWTPALGLALSVCAMFRIGLPFYNWKVWIVFGVLLFPFIECLRLL